MSKIEKFEDLHCWQAARVLVKHIYDTTNQGVFSSDYDMKRQIRRASISVMNNIAEGFGRYSKKDFIRFLEISVTSACEVKSMLYAALDQNYMAEEATKEPQAKAEIVKALNLGLIKYLRKPNDPNT